MSEAAVPSTAPVIDTDVVRSTGNTITRPARMLSLDVLRGLDLAFMIIVNSQPGPYTFHPLDHAPWNGFTPTDLVFPTFLFLVGISTVLSIAARRARGDSRSALLGHAVVRCVILIALGFVVNNFPFLHLSHARFYGVLPRIGVCYLAVAALYLWKPTWKDKLVWIGVCLIGYWALMRFVHVPGYGVPGQDIPVNDPTGNLAAWMDRHIFAPQHLYEQVRDPEGFLSTLPSIATTLVGVVTGIFLRSAKSLQEKAMALLLAGVGCILAGALWNLDFPINKKLWTSSFVLYAGGWSLVLLALTIYVVDIQRFGRKGLTDNAHPPIYKPLLVLGTNSIAAYMVAELLVAVLASFPLPGAGSWYRHWSMAWAHVFPYAGWNSLLFSLAVLAVVWVLIAQLYRRRIFLKI